MRALAVAVALASCAAAADDTPWDPAKAAGEQYCATVADQRKAVNALGDYDAAFTPPAGLKPAPAPIGRLRDAVFTLGVIVEIDGTISTAEVVHAVGEERSKPDAVKWALDSRYQKPATLNGVPVRACTRLTLRLVFRS
jgi:hypothetical protein